MTHHFLGVHPQPAACPLAGVTKPNSHKISIITSVMERTAVSLRTSNE